MASILRQRYEMHANGNTAEQALADLLADARHFCDPLGLDYGETDRIAYGHYRDEAVSILPIVARVTR